MDEIKDLYGLDFVISQSTNSKIVSSYQFDLKLSKG